LGSGEPQGITLGTTGVEKANACSEQDAYDEKRPDQPDKECTSAKHIYLHT
jgi:hypothetical protein